MNEKTYETSCDEEETNSSHTIITEFSGSDADISEMEREQELKNIKKNPKFNQANRMYGQLHRQQAEIVRRKERRRTYDRAMKKLLSLKYRAVRG